MLDSTILALAPDGGPSLLPLTDEALVVVRGAWLRVLAGT
jgi:hypothetical protein